MIALCSLLACWTCSVTPFPGILQSLAVPHAMVSVRPTIHDLQFLIDILPLDQQEFDANKVLMFTASDLGLCHHCRLVI
jgi:hypothetical protein